MTEFSLAEILPTPAGSGSILVSGRCVTSLKRGTIFSWAYSISSGIANPDSLEVIKSNARKISLKVDRILFCDLLWESIESGQTPTLELVGSGSEELREDDLLTD